MRPALVEEQIRHVDAPVCSALVAPVALRPHLFDRVHVGRQQENGVGRRVEHLAHQIGEMISPQQQRIVIDDSDPRVIRDSAEHRLQVHVEWTVISVSPLPVTLLPRPEAP